MQRTFDVRNRIISTFSEWTAFSATRSGCPLKSKVDVYPLIRKIDFNLLFDINRGAISEREFETWHKTNSLLLHDLRPEMPIGWTTKIINVYLKTRAYTANEGRTNLADVLHPPIDNGLRQGIHDKFPDRDEILDLVNRASRIKDIVNYEIYSDIINGCRLVAKELGCKLLEVEQLWKGTEI